jgi:alpha-glucosidase (family GH31 glycosyl hydrolase)
MRRLEAEVAPPRGLPGCPPAGRPRRLAPIAARLAHVAVVLGGAVLVWCADPAVSHAAVVINSTSVTVTAPDVRATITRAPFRIAIDNGAGVSALAEVPNTDPFPAVLTPTMYPQPLGGEPLPQNDLLAPLTFLVGTATTTQWGGGPVFFQGDEQTGLVAGIQYSARDVISARPDGDGAQLVLSTDDPTGRRLIVTVAPGPTGTIRVVATPSPSDGVAVISDAFASGPSEQFHGFGGRHNAINQHGNDFYSWIEEENTSGLPGTQAVENAAAGQPNYLFPDGPEAAYDAQALFYSSRPYGFMLDQTSFARWQMDSDRPDAWQVSVYGTRLNYLVAPGRPATAIKAITAITGRERVPPRWAIGPEIDRAQRAADPESASQVRTEVRSDIANIGRYHLPISSFRIEGWALLSPRVLTSVYRKLRARHIHPLVYVHAFVENPSGGLEPASDYSYAISHGLVATNANGTPATFGSPYQNGTAALLDFTNPATVAWWKTRIQDLLAQGADGFMQDFGEQVAVDWHFHDGQTGATMHNEYPILYDRVTRQAIDTFEHTHPGRQIFFYTRAGYSGDPGSAAYDGAEFLGDNSTSWDAASGLASVIPDMLNRGVGGAYGPTTDIGGYLDLLTPPTTPALFDRWAELSALTPFYRVHNSGETGTEMPWALGPQTLRIYRAMARLHIDAEPLILKLWTQADDTGLPIMRPLWLTDPDDAVGAAQDEEWMLGPHTLVAPVVTEGAASRSVSFPPGCWRNPDTGETYHGPVQATVPAPLAVLPYYFRCGTRPFNIDPAPAGGQQSTRSMPGSSRRRSSASVVTVTPSTMRATSTTDASTMSEVAVATQSCSAARAMTRSRADLRRLTPWIPPPPRSRSRPRSVSCCRPTRS